MFRTAIGVCLMFGLMVAGMWLIESILNEGFSGGLTFTERLLLVMVVLGANCVYLLYMIAGCITEIGEIINIGLGNIRSTVERIERNTNKSPF